MFHIPEHYYSLSLRLSEVLDDIGVNERLVKMQRRAAILSETSASFSLHGSYHIFGSYSEGSSTLGLHSDIDILVHRPRYNVIQDYAEWKRGLTNLLMIQDDITSPGYCHLQLIKPDTPQPVTDIIDPLPVTDIIDQHSFRDADGRILLKNTVFDDELELYNLGDKNGPARTQEGKPGISSADLVVALPCESWPSEAREWSQRRLGKWPTEDMKRYIENRGCFVVPVGSKVSQIEYLEWRISTSMAERCLMFNLNITQIRCLVLLKMILKTYLQHPLSSYMCKTVLLRCIEKTHYNLWQENNLLTCLTICLQALYSALLHKSCPHFFIPGNNLMARQFSPIMKDKLLNSLHHILEGKGAALYGIEIDDLGERLEIKMRPLYHSVHSPYLLSTRDTRLFCCGIKIKNVLKNATSILPSTETIYQTESSTTVSEKLLQDLLNFFKLYKNGTIIEKKALQLLVPFHCSILGSVLASVDIGTNHSVSPEALNWLSAGLNSDVSSGRLKLASVLYCAGDMLRAESVLKETERLYHLDSVEPICTCYEHPRTNIKSEHCRVCYNKNEKAIRSVCACCVKFFRAEINCIPFELQYELFRSTEDERLQRNRAIDIWMDMAVVDSLPFLYFLQYKTYGNLQNYNEQQRALEHLAFTVNLEENFAHRETALNLLGQCMEQENRKNDALAYYISSLNVRGRNNVAWFHRCRLLAEMQNTL